MTQPTMSVWVATEFDREDGGKAWIQAATSLDKAKQLCQDHYDKVRAAENLATKDLAWKIDAASQWLFDQETVSARLNDTTFQWYECRRVEVQV